MVALRSVYWTQTELYRTRLGAEGPPPAQPIEPPVEVRTPVATRADALTDEQQKTVAMRYELICALEDGLSHKEACGRAGIVCEPRTARNYQRAYRERGYDGLVDHRKGRTMPSPVMTPDVCQLVVDTWMRHPAAPQKRIWRVVKKNCAELGLPTPGYHSVRNLLKGQHEGLKLIRAGNRRQSR
jgi:hypothetical protein